ncbi:succinylglutamate desuccinylase/aspartoacylase family protein [Candidatus Azambacteria bacterium]|nr:succinylglutamate desuccinylase/aspartoacylase family protein [Candidatus Azambacteria bacterium]
MEPKSPKYLGIGYLKKHLNFIKNSSYQGVGGIWKIGASKSGPVLGITIHTHGNEPSGLAVLEYFREKFPLEQRLKNGVVIFSLNNIRATERFLAAKNTEEKMSSRFVDINMNRLPDNVMRCNKNDSRYEIRRVQELKNIWEQFDVGFDIHSTTQENDGMIMNIGAVHPQLIRGFPITDIITNIENVQIAKPAVFFYGNGSIPVMGIEAGSHESPQAFTRAIACTEVLLKNLGMIEGGTTTNDQKYREYFVDSSLIFPDASYSLVKQFKPYEEVIAGQKIATNGKHNLFAPLTGHVILAPSGMTVKNLDEEVMFFVRPPKITIFE